ncbi:primase homolog protein isoform X2 [Tripterygium wilfordii]|uniref:primase homolog protein isoform X2 n=1 Tax=Tripterygium wilfordii TaxID=458696 RepID=UPI0018F7FEF0|nr:primase homolog protein isoform X2 [Tripterygium wilfordii]
MALKINLCIQNFLRALPRARATDSVTSPSVSYACKANPSFSANAEALKEVQGSVEKLELLKQKIEHVGIDCVDLCTVGQYNNVYCPKCRGGQSKERSLSLHINQDGDFAMWRCFQVSCGWAGQVNITRRASFFKGQMTEDSLELEPLGEKLITYFGKRMISEDTLRRNAVVQSSHDQAVIAFPYRQNEVLVGCKFRTIEKRFWQAKGTERWLYGLDDIDEAAEIIIVEGEVDKLSMEEAGFRNCVSVPAGAPQKVSTKRVPYPEKDTAFQYLQNCKKYLEKVSRIILATDGDPPGQALAEELARRLGKERCWRVHWPRKDELEYFKDANEVLQSLGPYALKEVMEQAELY